MSIETIGGPWFEDFARGQEFDAPAVTLHAGYAAAYQALFGDRLRTALDHDATASLFGAPAVHPLLAIQIAIGQSTVVSQRVKANLFYRGLTLLRPVRLGDTLTTVTRIVGLRQNRPQPGRAPTGQVALEIRTSNQRGEPLLELWRCPMIPCRREDSDTGHRDDLDTLGRAAASKPPNERFASALAAWRGVDTRRWRGRRAAQIEVGQQFLIEARDTVTCAPELVRMTLNLAMAHTDARLSYLGQRLVYGGHVISIAHAQMLRALPNIITMLGWESCDHTAPVLENDRIRSGVRVLEKHADPAGALLLLQIESYAARGEPEQEQRVLEWRVWVLSA
ncbi:MAG: MaoC family dehydratase [Steroidobacteraceae bacterium]|nr:MaoC family dehydratase [Steroidobacteraceae bacterium]MDW8259766.1 MaoC family dehydratase [Gammaproteobacteria bacterium]